MPRLEAIEQRTPEWLEARRGKITASIAGAVLGVDPHKGPLAAYRQIAGTETPSENAAMRWGTQFEAQAKADYEVSTGELVWPGGFWVDHDLPWLAASPDGLIGEDKLLEIFCPQSLPEQPPAYKVVQMRVQLAVTQRRACEFLAWLPDNSRLWTVERDLDIEVTILAALQTWYDKHIRTNTPPARRREKKTVDIHAPPG